MLLIKVSKIYIYYFYYREYVWEVNDGCITFQLIFFKKNIKIKSVASIAKHFQLLNSRTCRYWIFEMWLLLLVAIYCYTLFYIGDCTFHVDLLCYIFIDILLYNLNKMEIKICREVFSFVVLVIVAAFKCHFNAMFDCFSFFFSSIRFLYISCGLYVYQGWQWQ